MKKFNCKHGLNPKEEIAARRLKDAIRENSMEVEQRIFKLYKTYALTYSKDDFYTYIKEHDSILYSAFERIGGIYELRSVMRKIELC